MKIQQRCICYAADAYVGLLHFFSRSKKDSLSKIFFLHLPKTAGTSLKKVVTDQYPFHRCVLIYSHDPGFYHSIKNRVTRADVVFGHIFYGIHNVFGVEGKYVTFLRNPIDRVVSFYNHQLVHNDSNYHMEVKAGMSLLSMLESEQYHQLNNHMVRLISGYQGTEQIHSEDILRNALAVIEKDFTFVGLIEKMASSMSLLRGELKWKKSITFPRLNVAPSKSYLQIDSVTTEAIIEYNKLDILLYQWVEKQLSSLE